MEGKKEVKKDSKAKWEPSGNYESKLKRHFNRGLTSFMVVAAAILFYFALFRIRDISGAIHKFFEVSKPIIYGLGIAYVLNPIVRLVDRHLAPQLEKKMKPETSKKVSRGIGITLSIVFVVALFVMLCNMIIPELYRSIRDMIFTLPGQINELIDKVNNLKMKNTTTNQMLHQVMNQGADSLERWLRSDLLEKINVLMTNLTMGIISAVSEFFKIIIGLIVSCYVLFSKERFRSQSKKAVYALFPAPKANLFIHILKKSDHIFGGFIIGKVIDSMIIGVLCYLGTSILRMPYALLVSVIVGVTNVIPFFGPYIGAIPSFVLIALVDPMKGLYFVLFILLLQQLDGNILGPKILGDSTGLSAFWVVFAILVGGGLFGFPGMVLGVPTFGVLYYIVDLLLNNKLIKRNLPTSSLQYDKGSYVSDQGVFHSSNEEELKADDKEIKAAEKETSKEEKEEQVSKKKGEE